MPPSRPWCTLVPPPPRPAQDEALGSVSPDKGLEAWPLERILAAMLPGAALDAGELLARLQVSGAAAPTLCLLQHRLHEGWIEGFLERSNPGRSRYRRIPGVTAART